MLKSLRDRLRLKVRVFEAGDTVGGTWYWNRYPAARCDSDAHIYCYTFDKQLLQEWDWSERYPEQPEILRYLEHVAQRHDLKHDIQFSTRVTGGECDEQTNLWTVHTDKGEFVMPLSSDMFFPPVDCQAEWRLISDAEFRPIQTIDGHLALFGTDPGMLSQFYKHLGELLATKA
jgi:hypothetical protein